MQFGFCKHHFAELQLLQTIHDVNVDKYMVLSVTQLKNPIQANTTHEMTESAKYFGGRN